MTISDYMAFLPNKRAITIKLNNGKEMIFSIALNISVELYNRIVSSMVMLEKQSEIKVQSEIISELTVDLLKTYHKDITQEWVLYNISIRTQKELIETIFAEIQAILKTDCFTFPDIIIDKNVETNKRNKDRDNERKKQKNKIEYLEKLLSDKRDYNLIDDIAILSTKTNNSFSEIQAMPIFVFRDLIRAVIISELRTDDDYNLAYLQYEAKKYDTEIKKDLPHYVPPKRKKNNNSETTKANQDNK